jgi:hypothetical protein
MVSAADRALVGALLLLVLAPVRQRWAPRQAMLYSPGTPPAALAPGTDFSAISVVRIRDGQPRGPDSDDVGPLQPLRERLTQQDLQRLLSRTLPSAVSALDDRLRPISQNMPHSSRSVTLEDWPAHLVLPTWRR